MTIRLAVVAALLALGGCLTVSQSEYPAVQLRPSENCLLW